MLESYGWSVPEVEYEVWKGKLEEYAAAQGEGDGREQHALMPLYHFATTSLPADTIAPEMSDPNATASLKSDIQFTGQDLSSGGYVDEEIMGKYLAYLVGIGFIGAPDGKGVRSLPHLEISEEQKDALLRVGGRGALV